MKTTRRTAMRLAPDHDGVQPVYAQIKDRLREEILRGRMKSLSKLPTVRELAANAQVSIGTMARVVEELVGEGLCIRRPRIGVYVNRESVLSGLRTIIWLSCGQQNQYGSYGLRVLSLDDGALYPDCRIQSLHLAPERMNSPAIAYELERIRSESPSCLLVAADNLGREAVGRILELGVPTLFVGDFPFGELSDPAVDQIREDTAERGYELIRGVHAAGCRTAAIFGCSPGRHWSTLLRAGADRAAREFGIALDYRRLVTEGQEHLGGPALDADKREHLAAALRNGPPQALAFEGHTGIGVITRLLAGLGVVAGRDITLISNRELVPGGILVQPDYARFTAEAARIIHGMASGAEIHPGSRILGGLVGYRLVTNYPSV